MTPEELTKAAMNHSGLTSTRTLGKHLKVSHMKVHSWLQNDICPSFEMAYALAELAGLPGVETAAKVRLHSPDGKKHVQLLRRIAQSAAAMTAVGLAVYISPVGSHDLDVHTSNDLYIMRSRM